jgi:uncharacterized membrane protein (DUF373 family)
MKNELVKTALVILLVFTCLGLAYWLATAILEEELMLGNPQDAGMIAVVVFVIIAVGVVISAVSIHTRNRRQRHRDAMMDGPEEEPEEM